jgi:steroid 5-alpha reductase family enzyme
MFLPIGFLNANVIDAPIAANDWVGWAMWVVGFVVEAWADQVKYWYKNDPKNKNHWCDAGPWYWSRHPNYFGGSCLCLRIIMNNNKNEPEKH